MTINGTYRHSKTGKLYEVIGTALHTESDEKLVIYKPLYESDHELFARPEVQFNEQVTIDGAVVSRFEFVPPRCSRMPVFVTGNPEKATQFAKLIGLSIEQQNVELDELQELDAKKLVEHKAKQAYDVLKRPVLVEDVSFVCDAWDGLPGPFVKYYVNAKNGVEALCRMLDGFTSRRAKAQCTYGYYDGDKPMFFVGEVVGTVADCPRGMRGYGFDRILQPDGFGGKTAAELSEDDYDRYYQQVKPFGIVGEFLRSIAKEEK